VSAGILSANQIKELTKSDKGTVRLLDMSGRPFPEKLIGLSAIDVPLGDKYWEMKGSTRTGEKLKVSDIIQRYSKTPNQPNVLGSDLVKLDKRSVYLFRADCNLDLRGLRIKGKATGRSSIGRLDVLVRLLVDESDSFDVIQDDKEHELFVEVTPISFDLQVKQGTILSQLRLFKGRDHDISLTKEELFHEEDDNFPVFDNNKPYRGPCNNQPNDIWFPFRLNLDPDPEARCCAFRAKKDEGLPPINPDEEKHYNPTEYWDPIPPENGTILLQPDYLYILRSKERLRIPPYLALECQSYTTQMGEWRIEYAGFAHPFFGRLRDDNKGTPIMFEVRGHNVPTLLTDGIPLGNVRFLRMSQPADRPKDNSYEKQELTLSKCFKRWPTQS
jgi:dCTP deaminase